MILQAPYLPDPGGIATPYYSVRAKAAATTAGIADLCIQIRRARSRALQAAFLHAERNQLAPQPSNRRLLT
ncbi:MAG: hypothetical protein AB7O88_25505 [Reyranellaceae bacterium]